MAVPGFEPRTFTSLGGNGELQFLNFSNWYSVGPWGLRSHSKKSLKMIINKEMSFCLFRPDVTVATTRPEVMTVVGKVRERVVVRINEVNVTVEDAGMEKSNQNSNKKLRNQRSGRCQCQNRPPEVVVPESFSGRGVRGRCRNVIKTS